MCMHYAQVYKRSCANLTDDDINGENLGIPTLLINVFQYVLSDAKSLGHMGPQCINSHFWDISSKVKYGIQGRVVIVC